MSDHLKDAVSYYFLDPEDKKPIKAISQNDMNIIEYIIAINERLGNMTLVSILQRWKKDADASVEEALEFYLDSEQLEEEVEKGAGDGWAKLLEKMKRAYVTIQEHTMIASHIYSIKRMSIHDGRPYYTILVNPEDDVPPQFEWFLNKEFRWASKDARDEVYEELKKSMRMNLMCKFLN